MVRRLRHTGRQLYAYGFPIGLLLGRGHIARLFHKLGKLVIGDVGDVHPEAVNLDLMRGALVGLGQLAVTAHQEYAAWHRSEEHTSELQSLMRISYAVFCLQKKNTLTQQN